MRNSIAKTASPYLFCINFNSYAKQYTNLKQNISLRMAFFYLFRKIFYNFSILKISP